MCLAASKLFSVVVIYQPEGEDIIAVHFGNSILDLKESVDACGLIDEDSEDGPEGAERDI